MKCRLVWCTILLSILSVSALFAQDTGTITGTVRDRSQAVIPGAEVKITGATGGIARTTVTNSDGDYLAAALPGGSYDITITATGFKTFKAAGVVLRVGQKARVDAALEVGQIATEVTVVGTQLNQVETQSSELAGTVTGKQMTQLNLNGRNFTQLIALTPGATNQSGSDEPGQGVSTVAYSVNGGRTEYNNFEIDGGSNQDDGSNTTLLTYPSLDSIAEFRVLTSNYGAQYGRNGSGTVEVETKSGTNAFHGDVYYFNRNDAYNAKGFFEPSVPEYKKHDYGYTIGGPVYIPKLYNQDKSKTFFFWSQEWRKDIVPGIVFNVPVPSAAERGCPGATTTCTPGTFGDFTDLCPPVGPAPDCPINPASGIRFPGNLVPIDPNAVPLLPMFPLPNAQTATGFVFNSAPAQATNWREELLRVDQNLSSKYHVAFRYIHDSWNQVTPNPLWTEGGSYPTIQDSFIQPSTSMLARLTATITPTLLNEFVFSYSTNHISFQNLGAWQRPAGYNLGLFQNGFGGGKLPGISLNGGQAFNGIIQDAGYVPNGPLNANPQYVFRDNVSKLWGKHNVQMGAYFLASQKNELPQFEPSVNGFISYDVGAPGSTGNPFADLLIGNMSSFGQASGQPKYYLRYKIFEPYVQDDWRVTNRLTLNLGLRISLYGTVFDNKQQAYNFNPLAFDRATAPAIDVDGSITGSPGALIPGSGNPFDGLVQCGGPGGPFPIPGFPNASAGPEPNRGCASGHLFNPAPRIGFAWDPRGDGKMAIRGGYGIFFEHTNGNEAVATALEGSPPLVQNPLQQNIQTTLDVSGNIVTSGYSQVGSSFGAAFPQSVVSIPQKQDWPYVQQWHLDIQQEVTKNTVFVLSYVGSKGTHLGRRLDLNQLRSVPANLNPYKPGEPIDALDPLILPPNPPTLHDDCATGTTASGVPIPGYNPGGLPTPGTPGVNLYVACGNSADPFRPFQGFSDIRRQENTASSGYNALQASLRRTVGALQFGLSYSFSHSIDDSSSGGDASFVDSYNSALNRASSNFDQRHVFTASYIYDLPFFKSGGLTHTVLGGWQFSGIVFSQTGTPFSVNNGGASIGGTTLAPGDNAGVGNGIGTGSRPDLIGNPNAGGGGGATSQFGPLLYNASAFVAPRGLTFGDAPRNVVRNPSQTNFDMALFKRFAIKEAMAFEFRAEAFNVFNHTQFGYVGGDAGSAGGNSSITAGNNSAGCYGVANYSAGDPSCLGVGFLRPNGAHNPRILQFGLKFLF